MAGLSCAAELQQVYDVTVYDTGRLRPGGRASSKQPQDPPSEDSEQSRYPLLRRYRYDHAAQFLSCASKGQEWKRDFDDQVKTWVEQGILTTVPSGSMYIFKNDDNSSRTWKATPIESSESGDNNAGLQFYYPTQGMSSLSQALVKEGAFRVHQDVWVSPSSGVKYNHGKWQVRAKGKVLGEHSHLVIAHNGKCADRLTSTTPARAVHSLLRVHFNDRVPASGGSKMTLNSIYSVTVALPSPSVLSQALSSGFLAGFVQNHPTLSMISCQTRKYPPSTYNDGEDDDAAVEVWNILSTASFAKRNKAPQEFLPEDVVANVTRWLVEAVDDMVLPDTDSSVALMDQLLEARVQLWGAAVPMNVWRSNGEDAGVGRDAGFIYDPEYQVGVCGDWTLDPSIAGAWTSGRRLAQHLKAASRISGDHEKQSLSVGLEGRFEASPSVRNLAIASLDGPMNKKGHNGPRKVVGSQGKPNNQSRRRNNGNNKSNGKKPPKNQDPRQKQPVAEIQA
jgi:predicted NAD/FAD-dependent oxidoreductase